MFGVGASHLAGDWHDLPLDVVGLDWRLGIDEARSKGITKTVQGNLDPSICLRHGKSLRRKQRKYLIRV